MKRFHVPKIPLCVLLAFAITVSAFSNDKIKIEGEAPTFRTDNPTYTGAVTQLNSALGDAFGLATLDLEGLVGNINALPERFIQAWGNASVFASHGATNRAYGGYKIFTATIGSVTGYQLPVNPVVFLQDPGILLTELNDSGDLSFGLNIQMLSAQVGFNMSFLVKNLYLGLRVGYLNLPSLFDNLSFKTTTVGILGNYQLLPRINLLGIIDWKGVNLGTGFIYQGTSLNVNVPLKQIRQEMGQVSTLGNLALLVDPVVFFNMDIKTYTIPIEAMTAIKVIFINVPFGLGVDLGFGDSKIGIGMKNVINIDGLNNPAIEQDKEGHLTADVGGTVSPIGFNIKLMTGLGFAFGPFILDIPFTYYFRGNGASLGMTLGVSF